MMQRSTARQVRILSVALMAVMACGPTSTTRPDPLGVEAQTLSICEAAQKSVGERVRVEATFDGFAYDLNSRFVTLTRSGEMCNDRGAGSIFAELYDASERTALMHAQPGVTRIILEGTVTEIEEGRFVHLDQAVVVP